MQLRRAWFGLLLLSASCSGEVDRAEAPRSVARLQAGLLDAFDASSDDAVDVIISYRDMAPAGSSMDTVRSANREKQAQMMSTYGQGLTVSRRFQHVPAFSARVSRAAFERLRQDPDIEYIQRDGKGSGQLKEAVPAIGADKVKAMFGVTGKGVRVAILDTGLGTMHPDLKDAVVAQHCFTQFDCPPTRANEGTSAEDDHGHGSNVAGIVGSRGMVAPIGFAPGAELVPVKINDQNDSGQLSDWIAGLDWIFDNLSMLKVKVVNMSICSTALYADAASCDAGEPAMARAVKNLVDAGVTLFAASGNLGMKDQLSSPACNTGVIAVAATYDSDVGSQPPNGATYASVYGSGVANCGDRTTAFDQITCFSNTPMRVDIVAPGAPMLSDGLNGKTSTYRGTSQASPVGAGVAALMLECNPNLKPADIKAAMQKTGVPRLDAKTGRMFPSLRALDVVASVCGTAAGGGGAGGQVAGGAGGPAAGSGGAVGGLAAGAGAGMPSAGTPAVVGSAGSVAPIAGIGSSTQGVRAAGAGALAAAGGGTTVVNAGASAAPGGVPAGVPNQAPVAAPTGCSCSTVGGGGGPLPSGSALVLLGVVGLFVTRVRRRYAGSATLPQT